MANCLIDFSIEEPPPAPPSSKPSINEDPLPARPANNYSSLLDRINASRKLEEECYGALKELIEENERLRAENMLLKSQITDTSEDTSAVFRPRPEAGIQKSQIESLENQLKAIRLSMETAPFVLVLIDGNAHTFVDSFFHQGAYGGAEAGSMLRNEVAAKIHQYAAGEDWKIVTKLYVDFESLLNDDKARTFSETGLRKFFGGFTQVELAFEAVDTGPGPKEAKLKMSEMLHLFASNVQCKHIFYACGPDAESLSALDTYRSNFIVSSSITLIKSKAYKDPDIYLPFEIMEIPSLFQGDIEESQDSSVSERVRTYSSSSPQKSRTKTNTSRQRQLVSTAVQESTWGPETKSILLNIDNQRVDAQLDKLDPKAIESFKQRTGKRKVCKWHHLDGRCLNGSCTYAHGPRLSAGEVDVLRFKNRAKPCENGSKCRNPYCHYGHMCPQVLCTRGNMCRFSHLHGISRDAIKIYNGSNDYEVTDSPAVAEFGTDSSSETSKNEEPVKTEAMVDNAVNFRVPSIILAPRNPFIGEEQDMKKVKEAEEAAEEPYKIFFARSKKGV
ncbi:MAG: hypothetical protein Q9195_007592 [Heterodermia aff. obscurata]